jgi:hypothetical protein
MIQQYIDYAQHIGADEYLLDWIDTTLKNYLLEHQPSIDEVEHILDYLVQTDKKISKMSYDQARVLSDKWTKSLQKKGANIIEKPEDIEIVLDFKDGFKVVKLVGKNAYKREGYLMRHCVADYYGREVEVYSLRDKDNMPHATMEKDQQIKGKGNGNIHPKYVDYVVKFLEYIGMTVGDSEMLHLGYISTEKFIDDLGEECKTKLFLGKYLPKNEKLIDKDGEEFSTLDLLDQIPLVSEVRDSLQINFDLSVFLGLSISFLLKKISKISYNSRNASSGYSSKNASSGNYSQNASSGNYSQNASSGYNSRNASSGKYSQNASSGDYSQNASSGDYSLNASSGYNSQNASSGDSSQNASSGYNSQNASSGHYSKNASSGKYSSIEMTGKNNVGAAIGENSKIKGIKGTWITLAEYDDNQNCVCVKSAQIDGKKIKENVWYKLEGRSFVECE